MALWTRGFRVQSEKAFSRTPRDRCGVYVQAKNYQIVKEPAAAPSETHHA